jgi:pyridoxamine 5'-phosphate oxidase
MEVINSKIVSLRKEYSSAFLNEEDVNHNPFKQFELWMHQAVEAEILEPHAMAVSTVSYEGKPSSRIVLLRGFDENGFVFYTNYKSHKGNDMAQNKYACLNFFWPELERQIRIEGSIEKIDQQISTDYFHSRPRESQIGAWASIQSAVIANRKVVEDAFILYTEKFKDLELIPKPEHWGGYNIKPTSIEFWQGRPSRLHDRLRYSILSEAWKIERLSP